MMLMDTLVGMLIMATVMSIATMIYIQVIKSSRFQVKQLAINYIDDYITETRQNRILLDEERSYELLTVTRSVESTGSSKAIKEVFFKAFDLNGKLISEHKILLAE